jgi:hypothetical protein
VDAAYACPPDAGSDTRCKDACPRCEVIVRRQFSRYPYCAARRFFNQVFERFAVKCGFAPEDDARLCEGMAFTAAQRRRPRPHG